MGTIAAVPAEDREDLRFALVMNGGVSLAVWIGGVTMEIDRLIRSEGVYGELLELTQSTARVDVVAGASAGGINGALLSMAIAHDADLEPVRGVWLDDGSLADLLRSPFQANPPSLLKGDEYFLGRLRTVFRQLATTNVTNPEDAPVRLLMMTTLLKGERLDFDDDFGVTLHEVIHRGMFDFRRQADGRDDFRTQNDADRLALASRCTASFPGAFEASFVPIGSTTEDPPRPDMDGVANFSSSRYVVDGGVLVNKPVGPVLRAIFGLPADRQVRRVLAYVVPDPGPVLDEEAVTQSDVPPIATVVMSALTLPRAESIGLDLLDLREHNRRVIGQRRIRQALLESGAGAGTDPQAMAIRLFDAYRSGRLDAMSDYALDQLTVGTRPLDAIGGPPPHSWTRSDLRDRLRSELARTLPVGLPADDADPAGWQWDVKAVETIGVIALDVLRAALTLAPPTQEWQGPRAALRDRRRDLHAVLGGLQRTRADDFAYWKRQAAVIGAADDLAVSVRAVVDGWTSTVLVDLATLPSRMAEVLVAAGPDLAVVASAPGLDAGGAALLRSRIDGLGVSADPPDERTCMRRLLALAVAQLALAAGQPELEQLVELAEINAYSKNGFDGRSQAKEKLAGVQLGHFGAFYKRSWRANDWMWGRLDGADRLAQVLLHPDRISTLAVASGRRGSDRRDRVLTAIEEVALGLDGTAKAVLARSWDRDAARAELDFLATDPPGPPPRRLDVCARAVARRIQLQAIIEELPWIADSIGDDDRAKAYESPKALSFKKAVDEARGAAAAAGRPDGIDPATAVHLFQRCEIGKERIGGEIRTDLFTTTVSTVAAVAVSAVGGGRSGVPALRTMLRSVRGFVLTLYLMARAAASSAKSEFAVLMLLLATGGAILAFALPLDRRLPGVLTTIGVLLVVAGLTLAALRASWLLLPVGLGTLALAIVPYVFLRYHYPSTWWAAKTVHALAPAAPILALIGGSMLLGVIHLRPRAPKEPGARRGP